MTYQDLLALEAAHPGMSREQLAALVQQQGTGTPPPGTPNVHGSMVPNPPAANYGPGGATGAAGGDPPPPTPAPTPTPTMTTGQPVDPAQWTQFTSDLGVASDTNHSQINTLMQRLQGAGYTVQPGPIDSMGRQDSLVINGVLTRVFDSSGNWKPVQDVNGSAWGGTGSIGGGTSGSGNYSGFLGSLGYGQGASFAPWTQTWQAPTAAQALQSPGVQFALQNSMRTMENSAAAQGVLGNARAQEAIANNLGQQLLGNYNQIYGQALTSYQQQQADFFANQDRPWNKSLQQANLGLQASSV